MDWKDSTVILVLGGGATAYQRPSRLRGVEADRFPTGLYTDESPGLKVDPVVVLVLSLGFIFSVVALHSRFPKPTITSPG